MCKEEKAKNFICKSSKIHSDKYDYSLVDYKNCETKVKIICPEHGIFEQRPYSHYKSGNGCIKCAEYKVGKSFMKTNKEFIDESNLIHDFRYDYSLVEYNGSRCNVKIICNTHGVFDQTPTNHLRGKGCPKCRSSNGESEIRKFLKKNEIKFNEQHTFKDCMNKQLLKFDFYLPDYNMCIEYDGIQHFKSIEYFGGDVKFKQIQVNDVIKNKYCEQNGVKLIRIKYDSNVEMELNDIDFRYYILI